MEHGLRFQLTGDAAERYDAHSHPLMAPFVEALADHVGEGDSVLDLACGTGYMTRAAAMRAGESGRVVGADVNQAMLDVATRRLPPTTTLVRAPADAIPLGGAEFDVVVCQQGIQFFPDLRAALMEVARVLRPGGRFAATAWAARERSPYHEAQGQAVRATAPGPNDESGPPAAFAMTREHFLSAAEAAGLVDSGVGEVAAEVVLPPLPGFAAAHLTALPFGAEIARRAPDAIPAIAQAITDDLSGYRTSEGVKVPFVSYLLTARKPV
ncbi:methyltransferase domain-containing protein [Streptomyces caeruleatus]